MFPVVYEPAPSVRATGGRAPGRGPQPGTVALTGVILEQSDRFRAGGIYNPRPINTAKGPGETWSIHALGRATDIMVPVDTHEWPTGFPQGNELADILVERHAELGIQQIMWARRYWRARTGWRNLSSKSLNHLDHLHIEQTSQAGRELTREMVAEAFNIRLTPPSAMLQPNDQSDWVIDLWLWLGMAPKGDIYQGVLVDRVVEFQEEHDLKVDGVVGPQTWAALTARGRQTHRVVGAIYTVALGRAPDMSGLTAWVTLIEGGTRASVALAKVQGSPEGIAVTARRKAALEAVPPPPPAPPTGEAGDLSKQEVVNQISRLLQELIK